MLILYMGKVIFLILCRCNYNMVFDNHVCIHCMEQLILVHFRKNEALSIQLVWLGIQLHMVLIFLLQNVSKFEGFSFQDIFRFLDLLFIFLVIRNIPYRGFICQDFNFCKLSPMQIEFQQDLEVVEQNLNQNHAFNIQLVQVAILQLVLLLNVMIHPMLILVFGCFICLHM